MRSLIIGHGLKCRRHTADEASCREGHAQDVIGAIVGFLGQHEPAGKAYGAYDCA